MSERGDLDRDRNGGLVRRVEDDHIAEEDGTVWRKRVSSLTSR
jgi:hypothetical protein